MFGIDLWEAGLGPALLVATVAGLLSFLSPCVLPIVPPYLAYMAGASMEEMREGGRADRRVMAAAVCFVLGLSTVFLILGLAASALGHLFLAWQRQMQIVGGLVILLFGLHFLGAIRIPCSIARPASMPATAAARRSAPMCWGSPSPLAGRPASVRSWARSWRSRHSRDRSSAACC